MNTDTYQLLPASRIHYAALDQEPLPGHVRAFVTRQARAFQFCTCYASGQCECCRSWVQSAVAREARRGVLA